MSYQPPRELVQEPAIEGWDRRLKWSYIRTCIISTLKRSIPWFQPCTGAIRSCRFRRNRDADYVAMVQEGDGSFPISYSLTHTHTHTLIHTHTCARTPTFLQQVGVDDRAHDFRHFLLFPLINPVQLQRQGSFATPLILDSWGHLPAHAAGYPCAYFCNPWLGEIIMPDTNDCGSFTESIALIMSSIKIIIYLLCVDLQLFSSRQCLVRLIVLHTWEKSVNWNRVKRVSLARLAARGVTIRCLCLQYDAARIAQCVCGGRRNRSLGLPYRVLLLQYSRRKLVCIV